MSKSKYCTVYEGITFAEGYNKSFADFKKEFENASAFKKVPHKSREAVMKKVHKKVLLETEIFNKEKADEAKSLEVEAQTVETKKTETKTEKNGDSTKTAREGKNVK